MGNFTLGLLALDKYLNFGLVIGFALHSSLQTFLLPSPYTHVGVGILIMKGDVQVRLRVQILNMVVLKPVALVGE